MRVLASCLGVLALMLMACGGPSTVPTPAPDTPTPTVIAVAPTPTVIVVAPTQAAAATTLTLAIDPAKSKASYHAHEQLVGQTLPGNPVGTSDGVSGSIVLSPDGSIVSEQSRVTVDLAKLKSDENRRDNFIKSNTLQTSRFPTAEFVPRKARELPSPLPATGAATFQLDGDLTVHGVTKPVTWQVDAQFEPAAVSGDATTTVNISDFGMTPPKAGPVLSIEDALTLEVAFSALRQT